MTGTRITAGDRVARAIVQLRRSPYNRAIQRRVYSVGDHELTPVQVDILEAVIGYPGARMNDLAGTLAVDASTLSRTIGPLVSLGFIERRPDRNDGRFTRVFPTDIGVEQGTLIDQSRRELMKAVHSHVSQDRLEIFADLLEEYLAAVTEVGSALLDDDNSARHGRD